MKHFTELSEKEAVSKISQLIEKAELCIFVTKKNETVFEIQSQGTQVVDEEGIIWVFSHISSDQSKLLHENNKAQLFYSNKSNAEYLSIYGEAYVEMDKEKLQQMWEPLSQTSTGIDRKDVDELAVIKVKPIKAYYLDTHENKIIKLLQQDNL